MKSKKFYLVITMCILSLLCSAGCSKSSQNSPATSSVPATPPPVSVPQTAPYTEQETAQGTVVTTPYFTVTLPAVWKNNYTIRYTTQNGNHYYRLVDATVGEEYGGHIFTFALYQDHLSGAETCAYNGTYLGVLQSDVAYMVVVESPTDLPVPEERAPIYMQLQETKQQVLASFTAANNAVFTPNGADNYRERAAMLQTDTTGKELAERFTADLGIPLTYVGFCADTLVTEENGTTVSRYDYSHHLYEDDQGNAYVIPLCYTSTTVDAIEPNVYQVTAYPHITNVWNLYFTGFTQTYLDLLQSLETDSGTYCLKDLNGEGVPELLIKENTTLSVYHVRPYSVSLIDQFDSITATMTYHYWCGTDFPGIVTVNVGGGQTHYGYLSLNGNVLQHQAVAFKDSPDPQTELAITPIIDDQSLINAVTAVVPELMFEPINNL